VRPLGERLVALGLTTETAIAHALAEALSLPHLDPLVPPSDARLLDLVPRALADRRLVLPLAVEGRWLRLAMADPLDLDAVRDVEFTSGLRARPAVAAPSRIREAIARVYGPQAPAEDADGAAASATEPILDLGAADDGTPAVRLVNAILAEGVSAGASDVHVEPGVDAIVVRNRVDGILRDARVLPRAHLPALVSRLKITASLDIAERRRPQDGRIKVRHGQRTLDVRVSTLPTHLGEKVVLRLLDPTRAVLSLEQLGLEPAARALVEAALAQPQGAILVTGPTGSGKTSTLYAALCRRRSPGINVVTLENPVEFQIPGVTQVHMNERAGLTFAACLRSIVRQDPDVIMVGEIRDPETAEIAFQAALTGHLVLSTLHTNSAAAAVTRLLDLGVEPFLVAASVTLVVAQRLVRRLCTRCRAPSSAPGDDPVFRARGCADCHGTGYRGRVGVFELLPVDGTLRELITERAPEAALRRAASARGLPTLAEAAAAKVREGATSPEEVSRVVAGPVFA
jgi:type IV pilus assembly protein PilB